MNTFKIRSDKKEKQVKNTADNVHKAYYTRPPPPSYMTTVEVTSEDLDITELFLNEVSDIYAVEGR